MIPNSIIQHFQISGEFSNPKSGGQKKVYFVIIGGNQYVLKSYIAGYDVRLERELQIYSMFEKENGIPNVLSTLVEGHNVYILEEYIAGNTLTEIQDTYLQDTNAVKKLLLELICILEAVWDNEFVHRDIKPDNIIIKGNGCPVLLDFGIARNNNEDITFTGFQPHSPLFGSPEQYFAFKEHITSKTDIFSLGVLGYFLYTGRLPFGNTQDEIRNNFNVNYDPFTQEDEIPNGNFKEFLMLALKIKAAERPRKIETLKKLLS